MATLEQEHKELNTEEIKLEDCKGEILEDGKGDETDGNN